MPVSYRLVDKTSRLAIIAAAVNSLSVGAATGTPSNGSLVVGTSAFVNTPGTAAVSASTTGVLFILPLPSAGVAVNGATLALLASTATVAASASGTAANAAVINNAGTVVVGGLTVGTSATDVVLNSTSITNGQTAQVSSATITHP